MSNAVLIRDLYRAFATRDTERLRALLSADVEWCQSPGFPAGEIRVGVEAVLRGIVGAFERDWQGWRFHPASFLETENKVVVLGAYRAQNRASGKTVDSETAHVFDIEDGQVVRFRQYADTKVIHDAMASRPPRQATRTSALPKFLPSSMPMNAAGAFSRPSVISSR